MGDLEGMNLKCNGHTICLDWDKSFYERYVCHRLEFQMALPVDLTADNHKPELFLAHPAQQHQTLTEDLDRFIKCQICFENMKNRTLIPCGHAVCSGCSDLLLEKKAKHLCPFCQQPVLKSNKLFL